MNQVVDLERPFTEDKVKKVIFDMDGAKAPGPDGFSMHFFQKCWDIIKEDLMKVFLEFFERGIMSMVMKSTFIVLILKMEGASGMGDFRLISLVTSLYKIISKALAWRLRTIMGDVVSATQSTFIQERQILDNILIDNECVDSMMRSRSKGVVCKVDMEKAYDRVDWDFLF